MSRAHFMFDHVTTLPHTMVPLALAVHVVWSQVYDGRSQAGDAKEQVLNSIAFAFMSKAKIYEYLPDAHTRPRALLINEIAGGTFVGGGNELQFSDGRAPRCHLAIAAKDVTAVIEMLRRENQAKVS